MFKRIVIFVVFISISFSLSACNSNSQPTEFNKLQEIRVLDSNYLFFQKNESKQLKLVLPYKVEELHIEKLSLVGHENVKVRILDIIENTISISINEYISEFDKVKVTLKEGSTLVLSVGNYFFELIDIPNNATQTDDKWNVENLHSYTDETLSYISNVTFKNVNSNSRVDIQMPQAFIQVLKISQPKITKVAEKKYSYKFQITDSFLKQTKTKNISTETIWYQENLKTKEHKFILKEFIPLSLNVSE
ncbi:hypothetical protein [Paenibacillus apii]|uniref:hypothetical protein n=1 Tax=Paenibacillus apii TaxID=1850370 RepID=UPI00143AC5CD|nr:hypothetical protein [Paenibacillus apii]NJJ39174.1 hypothetical protein [Paenibacillus apii]